jgi:tRNA1Val (adenine37-N6)-methyltransferase
MKGDNETVDELQNYGLRIVQPRHGYRFSLDPLLLCDFAELVAGGRVIDLGAGCGVIPLVLARKDEGAQIVGVEFQHEMAALATRNVRLNGLAGRIEIVEADINSLRKLFPVSSFDLVVANPPYRKPGSGKISPRAGRDRARHESTAGLAEFLAAAKYLVKPAGSICLIYHTSRLADCLAEAERQRLAPVRLRFVHGSPEAEARMFLVELVKGRKGELTVLSPCFVSAGIGDERAEMPYSKGGETE